MGYLSMNNAFPAKVHWFNIAYSLIIVFVLSAMIAAILVRNLRRDFNRYNRLSTDEEKAEDMEEFGWKLVHADVFRPPSFSPLLMAVCSGTGAQLLCMAVLTILFSAMGFLSPSNRGPLSWRSFSCMSSWALWRGMSRHGCTKLSRGRVGRRLQYALLLGSRASVLEYS